MAIAYVPTDTLNITPLMTPERIIGALIWATAHGLMTEDLLALVDQIPLEYVRQLPDDLATMIRALQCGRHDLDDPDICQAVHLTAGNGNDPGQVG